MDIALSPERNRNKTENTETRNRSLTEHGYHDGQSQSYLPHRMPRNDLHPQSQLVDPLKSRSLNLSGLAYLDPSPSQRTTRQFWDLVCSSLAIPQYLSSSQPGPCTLALSFACGTRYTLHHDQPLWNTRVNCLIPIVHARFGWLSQDERHFFSDFSLLLVPNVVPSRAELSKSGKQEFILQLGSLGGGIY